MYKEEINPKTLLNTEDFKKYKNSNRKWFVIHTITLISIFVIVTVSILHKELELGIYTGSLLFLYLISLGVIASKNKLNWFLWVLFTAISMILLPLIGMVFSYVSITKKGFKNGWLAK